MRDLTHTIVTGLPVYPGDPAVAVINAFTLDDDGVAVSQVHFGTHTGTHVDAPSHTVAGGRTMAEISLKELVGEALIMHIKAGPRQQITAEDLDIPGSVPSIVALATGWDRYFGTSEYLEHPFLSRDAATLLWERGMRVLAVDTLSPDATPSADFAVHDVVLGGDGLIVENLTGLTALGSRARLAFYPLKLGAVDGAPVRAIAEVLRSESECAEGRCCG